MLIVASYFVVDRYGASAYIPGVVSGFAATLIAFVLALEFETRRERRSVAHVGDAQSSSGMPAKRPLNS